MSRTFSTNSGSVESLKVSSAMRLQAEGAPDAADARGRDAAVPRHAARAPVRGVGRLALQRLHDDALDLGVVDLARDARPRLVEQPVETTLDKTLAPFADGLRRHPLVRRHRLVAQARGAAEHDPRPQRQSLSRLAALRIAFENAGNLTRQFDLSDWATGPHPLAPAAAASPINYTTNFWLGTLGEAGARPFFRCPQVKAKAAIPCHDDGSDNGRRGGLPLLIPDQLRDCSIYGGKWSHDDLPQTLGTGGN